MMCRGNNQNIKPASENLQIFTKCLLCAGTVLESRGAALSMTGIEEELKS